jgi:hypothetical protein
MVTRFLKNSLFAGLISLLILIFIPADPKNALFLGFPAGGCFLGLGAAP